MRGAVAGLVLAVGCGGDAPKDTVPDDSAPHSAAPPPETDTDTDADTDTDTDADPGPAHTGTAAHTGTPTAPTTTPLGGCEVSVPAAAVVVEDPAVFSGADVAWVCRGAVATVTGARGAYYVDDRGSLVVSGDDNVIYARAGTDLVVASGATGNTFYLEDSSTLLDESGGATTVVACDPFSFDTASAPSPGCR